MKISKEQIEELMSKIGAKALFAGADVYSLKRGVIETRKVETVEDLLIEVFKTGEMSKVYEVKDVLKIVDPRH